MKKNIITFLLLILLFYSCDLENDNNNVPELTLPPTVYGQLPTRNSIIQTAEAVGAINVQVIRYRIANGTGQNTGSVSTNGGIQPSWWRSDRKWATSSYIPTLVSLFVLYEETDTMHPNISVRTALYRLFANAGFEDATWFPCPVDVDTTTDNDYRLIPLPTHAEVIYTVELLGASNVKINSYRVYSRDAFDWVSVPTDGSYNASKGSIAIPSRSIAISYAHPGLGSIITNTDVVNAVKELFRRYGFEVDESRSTDITATGTFISTSFPLPSFNQIIQAAEQAGANNVEVKYYITNNVNVIPMNEGSRLADIPIIVEIYYNGQAIPAVTTNVKALFVNFTNAHIGNNSIAMLPLPTGREVWRAAINVLYFSDLVWEPSIYTINGAWFDNFYTVYADWTARIKVFIQGDGTNTAEYAGYAVEAIVKLFNTRGFYNLDISVTNR